MDALSIGILEGDGFSPRAIRALEALGPVSALGDVADMDAFLADKDVLFIRLAHRIDADLLDRCPRLRYLCTPTTGLNHIDTDETARRGIRILSLRGEAAFLSTIRATPEHILGLTIALLRQYSRAFISDERDWDRDRFIGEEIYGNRIGIIGYGRIGKLLCAFYQALGAKVFVHDIEPDAADGCAEFLPDVEALVDSANIVILAASFLPENGVVVDRALIDRMRGKYFINTARGELVDEGHLLERIVQGWFKGVAIDVIGDEIRNRGFRRKLLDEAARKRVNLIVTPHIGGATRTSMQRTEEFICDKLLQTLESEAS